jgi:hypothetical protein
MNTHLSFYELLQVSPEADIEVIKAAYRARSKKVHPDAGGSEAEAKALNHAYEVLSDPTKRAAYDSSIGLRRETRKSKGSAPPPPSEPAKVSITCLSCGTPNRILCDKVAQAVCGGCWKPLRPEENTTGAKIPVVCPSCGLTNKVFPDKYAQAKCGACSSRLKPEARTFEYSQSYTTALILQVLLWSTAAFLLLYLLSRPA